MAHDPASGCHIDLRVDDGIIAYSLNDQPTERVDVKILRDQLKIQDQQDQRPDGRLFAYELLRRFVNYNASPPDAEEETLP